MWNTVITIISGVLLTIFIYIQKPIDSGITGAFLGAAGSDESFTESKDIGVDKVIRVITWILFVVFIFFFTLHFWVK